MQESFGARMRERREERNVALATIAEQTKIKRSLLEALERDDVSRWPSGIFRRAYIRAYAHAVGLCPDDTVREFLAVHPDPDDVIGTAGASAAMVDQAAAAGGPPSRLRFMVGSAIGSLSRLRRPPVADSVPAGEIPPVAPVVAADIPPLNEPQPCKLDLEVAAVLPCETPKPEPTTMIADCSAAIEPESVDTDFLAVAHLCTDLGRADAADALRPLLKRAARILEATGLIVWVWDAVAAELMPVLAHGYSESMIARLPGVSPDEDNATAAAFRSAEACAIEGDDETSGALVVPMLTPAGCAGVLALELPHGREQERSVRAAATILAAVLAQLVGERRSADALPEEKPHDRGRRPA